MASNLVPGTGQRTVFSGNADINRYLEKQPFGQDRCAIVGVTARAGLISEMSTLVPHSLEHGPHSFSLWPLSLA